MKKRIFILIEIIIIILTLTSCRKAKKPTSVIEDDTLVSKVIEKPATGSTYTSDALDNVFISLYVFSKQKYFKSSSTGTAKAKVLGFNYTQKIYIDKQRTPECTFLQQISRSGLKKTAEQKMIYSDRAVIRSATKITNNSVSWEESGSEIVNHEKYKNLYGYLPYYYTGYILNKDMILNYDVVTNTEDEFKIYLNLDPEKSVNDYKIDVKTNGGMSDYPSFYYSHMTITMKANWEVTEVTLDEKYDMTLPGIGTISCVTNSTDTFNYDENTIVEKDYYDQYLTLPVPGGVSNDVSNDTVKDENYYLQSLVGCLTKNDVAGFEVIAGSEQYSTKGKAFLDIADLNNLSAMIDMGSLHISVVDNVLRIVTPFGNFSYDLGDFLTNLVGQDSKSNDDQSIKFIMDKTENEILLSTTILDKPLIKVEILLLEEDDVNLKYINVIFDNYGMFTLNLINETTEIKYDNSVDYQKLENLEWLIKNINEYLAYEELHFFGSIDLNGGLLNFSIYFLSTPYLKIEYKGYIIEGYVMEGSIYGNIFNQAYVMVNIDTLSKLVSSKTEEINITKIIEIINEVRMLIFIEENQIEFNFKDNDIILMKSDNDYKISVNGLIIDLSIDDERKECDFDEHDYQRLENLEWLVDKVQLLSQAEKIDIEFKYEKDNYAINVLYLISDELKVMKFDLILDGRNYSIYFIVSDGDYYLSIFGKLIKANKDEIEDYFQYIEKQFSGKIRNDLLSFFEKIRFDLLIKELLIVPDGVHCDMDILLNNYSVNLDMMMSELSNGILIESDKDGIKTTITTYEENIIIPIELEKDYISFDKLREYDYLIEEVIEIISAQAMKLSVSGKVEDVEYCASIWTSISCTNVTISFSNSEKTIELVMSIYDDCIYGKIEMLEFEFNIKELTAFLKLLQEYFETEFQINLSVQVLNELNNLFNIIIDMDNNVSISKEAQGIEITGNFGIIKVEPFYESVLPIVEELKNPLDIEKLTLMLDYVSAINKIIKQQYLNLSGKFKVEKVENESKRVAYECATNAYITFSNDEILSAYAKVVVTGDEDAYCELIYINDEIRLVYSSDVSLDKQNLINSSYQNGLRILITKDEFSNLVNKMLVIKNEIIPSCQTFDFFSLVVNLLRTDFSISVSDQLLNINSLNNFNASIRKEENNITGFSFVNLEYQDNIISGDIDNIIGKINIADFRIDDVIILDKIGDLVDVAYNTIKQNELKISGTAKALGIEVPIEGRVVLTPKLKIYIKLQLPYLLGVTNNKTDTYIYYIDDVLYIKRDLYKYVFLKGQQYDKSDYVKMSWNEFNNDLVENIFYILNFTDSIKKMATANPSSNSKLKFDYFIKNYNCIDNCDYSIVLDFSCLSSVLNDFACTIKTNSDNGISHIGKLSGSLKIVNLIDIQYSLDIIDFSLPVDMTVIPNNLANDASYVKKY